MDLSTSYLGLALDNPIIVGAGPLTMDANSIVKCEDAGAAAVVLKSLFEEQITSDTASLSEALISQENMHAEVYEYLEASVGMRYGTRKYLETIAEAKRKVNIPVIASINCISDKWWRDFAQEVEAAGADALELNIMLQPRRAIETAPEIEQRYFDIIAAARESVKLPVAVKLGLHFSSIPNMVLRLARHGADACVMFNRFWNPDIDVENEKIVIGERRSANTERAHALRWIALLSGNINIQFAAATGIHSGTDVVRMLLAGADATQVVTAPLTQGRQCIAKMTDEIKTWMQSKGYEKIADFKGKMSQTRNPDSEIFQRTQYMKALGTNLK